MKVTNNALLAILVSSITGAALDPTVDSANKQMRGGATLRSDSTDESIYQVIKDLKKRTAELEAALKSHRDISEKRIADLEAERMSHQEAKLETKQEDLMGALKVMLTQDVISEIAGAVIGNEVFDDGVATLVQDTLANDHPPEYLMEQARSLPVADTETYVNAGETTTLNSGDWCISLHGFWDTSRRGVGERWMVQSVPYGWDTGCGSCPNGFNIIPRLNVQIDEAHPIHHPKVQYWHTCNY